MPVAIILSGGIGSGKTRTAEVLAQELAARGVAIGGVLAPRILSAGETVGYRIRDVLTGEERPFASLEPSGIRVSRFFVSEQGLAFALAAIEHGEEQAQVVFVDEVGRWELAGGGLAPAIQGLLHSKALSVLLVRSELVEAVARTFPIQGFDRIEIGDCGAS
jgi:nucleoside-triphosphatase THEP1